MIFFVYRMSRKIWQTFFGVVTVFIILFDYALTKAGHHPMEHSARSLQADNLKPDKGRLEWLWLRACFFLIYLLLSLRYDNGL